MKNRYLYGYFRSKNDAEEHLVQMKRNDIATKKTFEYRCEKRNRFKEGRKQWLAYRMEIR